MDNLVFSPHSHKLKSDAVGDRKDLISTLPDAVLHHILSFLSSKYAIRTSILAKRWKFLWTYLSDFNLKEYLSKNKTQEQTGNNLFNLVDKILQKPKYIKRFRLLIRGIFVEAQQTNSWISALLKYKIEEFYLSVKLRSSSVLANNLVAPESLNMLVLELRSGSEIPCCIYFPGLKTLELSRVSFSDETSVQQFFSDCPVLQKLTLSSCDWNINNVSIKFPTLTTLIIVDYGYDDYDEDYLSYICEVTTDAANLKCLRYTNYVCDEFVLTNLTSLMEASIHVSDGLNVARAIKLLSGISHVKSLKLSSSTLWILSNVENLLSHLPTFHNLTHICVDLERLDSTAKLMDILEKFPNLETLDIVEIHASRIVIH